MSSGCARGDAQEPATTAEAAAGPVLPDGIGTRPIEQPADDADDAELASYNAYLARLNAEVKGTTSGAAPVRHPLTDWRK